MPNRTQIVCLHEGQKGHSIDPIFINRVLRGLQPSWIRPSGSNVVRLVGCGGRKELIRRMPVELKACLTQGADTTLMVWSDLDADMADGPALKKLFWAEAKKAGISRSQFDTIVFIFAKDRLENWVEFLIKRATDETREGPRAENDRAAEAAIELARRCRANLPTELPQSLEWSCKNWRVLVRRMTSPG